MVTTEQLVLIFNNITKVINENWRYLTELDGAIGDGDHGINMNKGFQTVSEKLEGVKDKDCGTILKTVAMTLITTVGGASGPLYGTAFLKASSAVMGKMELTGSDVVRMFDEAIKGIMDRGKAVQGEKTMLDSLIPAYVALQKSLENGEQCPRAFSLAAEAALKGMEGTKNIRATKGRASYLGDRSIGHQDPGATSSYMIIRAISDTLNKRG